MRFIIVDYPGNPLVVPRLRLKENRDKILQEKNQRHQDYIDRIAIEGRFGVGKRRYGMDRIKAKLPNTSESAIYITSLVMNLDKIVMEDIKRLKDKYKIKWGNAA